ncbi:MAG: zinc dependent phospholipase C family protein [bacterium]|nr:zinc dependent phospholipase C family protein [bacterium]
MTSTLPHLIVLLLFSTALALAWGPGHHLEFASRVWRRRREMLPTNRARLLGSEKEAYFYGNLAADIINMKAWGGHKNHCHRWTIVEEMREHAETDAEEAFILGYLSHLAADTIAHNHFVPYHLVRYARGRGLGHLYWEMNADRFVPESRWSIVTGLKDDAGLDELDELVNRTVPKKALSMGTNKKIFNHVLLVSERKSWRRGVDALHPIGQVVLTKGFLGRFQNAAVDRVRLALKPKGLRRLLHIDTSGKEAQKEAAKLRKVLVQRYPPGAYRRAHSEELARPFIDGMESPPRSARGGPQPLWPG